MVTAPHIIVGLERTSDNRGVRLQRSHCIVNSHTHISSVRNSGQHSDIFLMNYDARTIVCPPLAPYF